MILTVQDLATYLKVHPSTIYRLLKHGELPAFRVGCDWRFNSESIDKWLLQLEVSIASDGRATKAFVTKEPESR